VSVDDEDDVVEEDDRSVAVDFVSRLGNGSVDTVGDGLDVEQVVCHGGAGRNRKRIARSTPFMGYLISVSCGDAARGYHKAFAATTSWIYRVHIVGNLTLDYFPLARSSSPSVYR